MNLRRHASGKSCQIRVPEVCNFNPETTVLCHLRIAGMSGMGFKVPDLLGAWGCSSCHQYVDANHPDSRLLLLEGVARTIAELLEEGVLHFSSEAHRLSEET
jgi:hypothetical protein